MTQHSGVEIPNGTNMGWPPSPLSPLSPLKAARHVELLAELVLPTEGWRTDHNSSCECWKKNMTRAITPVSLTSIHYFFVMPGPYQRLDSNQDSRCYLLHFDVSYDSKEPILTKIRLGEVRVRNLSSHHPTSPDRISMNIGLLASVFVPKCRI